LLYYHLRHLLLSSRRFESRWINVQIADDSPSMWLAGMGGSTIGVWAAHGEGQVLFPDAAVQAAVLDKKLAPIRCVYSRLI
jgi:phosphoribosylformylglycinamidine (FGAM) synthase-like amidotransferase family enzyme